jgi:trehalose 6-phosphate synthase
VANARVVIASNRGPLSFRYDGEDRLASSRGGGGLVTAMTSAAATPDTLWLCAALSDADREAAQACPDGRIDQGGHDTGGAAVAMLPIDPGVLAAAYTRFSTSTLWHLNHGLTDVVATTTDDAWRRDWESYVDYNQTFAAAIADLAADGAKILVQDYHLDLVPAALRALRSDLRIGHFTHTPWATRDDFARLPADVAEALLFGMLGADSLGFHAPRWAADFADCAVDVLGATYDDNAVTHAGRAVPLRIHALGVDPEPLRARAAEADVRKRIAGLRTKIGKDKQIIGRVDRTEPAKNIHRGLLAVAQLFRDHPEHLGNVVHVAIEYPSRQDVAEYRNYTADCVALAEEINSELSTADWTPVLLNVRDDYPRSLATLCDSDVLLVNSLRDGMNLVAKEGALLSNDSTLVLSRETGAADEMAVGALLVDPLDVEATAEALHTALTMSAAERADRHRKLAEVAAALPPRAWLQAQLDALS